ncbi:MAG: hypothetical protein IT305_03555 [Chloroflexi bacterium]|nr:hypothetical protein [Chloroflexota bacterium]
MSERWEREIDELLRRREAKLRREPISRRVARKSAPFTSGLAGALRAFLRRPPVEQFMIASIFLVAVTMLFQMLPISPTLARWAGLLSLLFFILALVLSIASHRGFGPRGTKRWRDREVTYGSSHPSLWDNLRVWWRRRRLR